MAARAAERHLVTMAAGAERQHPVTHARLQPDHAVDIRVVAEHGLHAAQVAQLFLAHIANEHQVAHGAHLVVVEHLEP